MSFTKHALRKLEHLRDPRKKQLWGVGSRKQQQRRPARTRRGAADETRHDRHRPTSHHQSGRDWDGRWRGGAWRGRKQNTGGGRPGSLSSALPAGFCCRLSAPFPAIGEFPVHGWDLGGTTRDKKKMNSATLGSVSGGTGKVCCTSIIAF